MAHPLYVDRVLHRVARFVGPAAKSNSALGAIRGYFYALSLVCRDMQVFFAQPRMVTEVHCSGICHDVLAATSRMTPYCSPEWQWRRYEEAQKVRWRWEYQEWGDYSDDESYRGRIIHFEDY